MSEIQAMQIIQKVLEKLDRKERERVLTWACSKFADQNEAPVTESAPTAQSHIATAVKVANESRKSEFDIVSSLEAEFEPEDGVSAKYFVRHAKPQTNKVKCLLATYYLQVFARLQAHLHRLHLHFFSSRRLAYAFRLEKFCSPGRQKRLPGNQSFRGFTGDGIGY